MALFDIEKLFNPDKVGRSFVKIIGIELSLIAIILFLLMIF